MFYIIHELEAAFRVMFNYKKILLKSIISSCSGTRGKTFKGIPVLKIKSPEGIFTRLEAGSEEAHFFLLRHMEL